MIALSLTQEAKSDLVSVLSSLEAHWHVLEAEVIEINNDVDFCEQCLRKYGEWFNSPLQYLKVRRVDGRSLADGDSARCPFPGFRCPLLVNAGAQTHEEEQNERDYPYYGGLQLQLAGRKEAGEGSRETGGVWTAGGHGGSSRQLAVAGKFA